MGALIGIGALINKNTFEGERLFERGAYWKEGAKSNHYGKSKLRLGQFFLNNFPLSRSVSSFKVGIFLSSFI